MKSTKCDKGNAGELPYPKLMMGALGNVVLMTSDKHGTVVHTEGYYEKGLTLACWQMDCFDDYSGTITLENSNDT
jgi:hypothetical protein